MQHELLRMRREIDRRLADRAEPRMGRITSFDPTTHSVKVLVLPEGDFPLQSGEVNETGWIPLAPLCPGNGWGVYAPPAVGTQVMLVHQEAAHGAPVAVVGLNDLSNPSPNVLSGEIWLLHANGSFMKLTNDGNMSLNVAGSGNYVINVGGNVTLTAQGVVDLLSADQVNLGAVGGKKVVRDGDPVSTGGFVHATTSTVFSA